MPLEACHAVSAAIGVLGDAPIHKGVVVNNENTVSMINQPVASVSLGSPSTAFDICIIHCKGNGIMR